jgi:formylglycine-generating enzyme required for sulfatase activity
VDYDARLGKYPAAQTLPLLRQVAYSESGFLTGTETYCVTLTGAITPIEVTGFLAVEGEPASVAAAAGTPRPTLTATATRTPPGGATVSPANATVTAFALTRVAFENRTPTPTPTATATPDATATAVSLMIGAMATAEAAPFHIFDLWVNPVDGAVYVYVPAGEFTMGAGDGDADEQPVHKVTLDDYWIMQTEVTNAQYERCVRAGVCTAPNNSVWRDVRFADHPVTDVDWNQASVYAEWVGGRLPTEAEWEKAARGDDLRSYPWGNEDPTCALANYEGCGGGTKAVGSHPAGASPYGALDMAGNVWEWVADWYGANYYAQSPAENPTGPSSGDLRVVRGGSWFGNVVFVRAASRVGFGTDIRGDDLGFRVALSPQL